VLLGSYNSIPDTIFTGQMRWLGMKVEDEEMKPPKPIASIGYAFHSATSDTAEYAHIATSDGDWVISGDNIYRWQGNVGIGLDNPATKLEVRDTSGVIARFSGAERRMDIGEGNAVKPFLVPTDVYFEHEASNSATSELNIVMNGGAMSDESGGISFWTGLQSSPETRLRIAKDGNVGIGTTDPTEELDVVGNIKMVDGNQAAGKVLTSDASGVGTWQTVSGGIPSGIIVIWWGSIGSIPEGWALCDGTNGTPDLRDRFIVGAGSSYNVGDTGGEAFHTLTINEMPSHTHTTTWYEHGGPPGIQVPIGAQHTDPFTSTSNPTGGDQPHENRPPYYSLAYIMKL